MNKFLTFAVVLMLALTTISVFATKENANTLPTDSSSGKAAIGGAFTLTDSNGKSISDKDFRGKYMLVFFGFTHCPDVCPLTMATLTKTLELLGDKADSFAPVFISVDPKRDTSERMKEYLSNFDSRIVGLTGSMNDIKDVASLYKAFYSEVPEKKADDAHADHTKHAEHMDHSAHAAASDNYMVDHSSFIYLMSKEGEYITHFPHTIAPEELAKKLSESAK